MEVPHDLVEEIISRLSVKSLLRFKSVSRRWRWTLESQHFKKRHMTHHQSLDPNFLLVEGLFEPINFCLMRMLVLGSSVPIELPCPNPPPRRIDIPAIEFNVPPKVTNSCDGMICCYDRFGEIFVVNPSTRWYRQIHGAGYQEIYSLLRERGKMPTARYSYDKLGFGKDIYTGAYKLVWLYNNFKRHEDSVTTCEIFDFDQTNTWRYVKSFPYVIFDACQEPVYVDGSLHWLINDGPDTTKTRVVSFDFHKETFEATFVLPTPSRNFGLLNVSNLNNRLCLSEKAWPKQYIWVLNHEDKTWEIMYSLDLPYFPREFFPGNEMDRQVTIPLAILKKKNKLLLFDGIDRNPGPSLVIYDHDLRSYGKCFDRGICNGMVPYYPSLISIPF
ncbi:hypothetical protein CARUB_v10011146mg [Capsella rubella]|uniref:F-box domain-containing protein n=1 Tax=Capsella rubella TaxID=81985 RepID=R0GSA8_9BRAS|nr:hypothetical protein CARUB_v10011146mg [Capsella rubella]